MLIEVEHGFAATHLHMVPPGVWGKAHAHDWLWTVRLAGDLVHPYGWVADFDVVRATMAECVADHYDWTTERILLILVAKLPPRLPAGVRLVWSRLQEKPGQAAIWEP